MDAEGRTPELWYRSLPPLTRFSITVTFVLTLAATVGLFNPQYILLDWELILRKGQIWRLVTDYFWAGPFSLQWLFHMYFVVTFSAKLEVNELFTTSSGAYLFFLLFQVFVMDIASLLIFWPTGRTMMCNSLVMAIIYYWSKREPLSPIGLWGFTLKAFQFPFALLFLDLIMGQSLWLGIIGISAGHIYYGIRDILPEQKGIKLMETAPKFCDEIMDRCARFDRTNIVGSLKILLQGDKAAAARPTPAGTAAGGQDPAAFPRPTFATLRQPSGGGGTGERRDTTRERLFSGQGHRLG